jgi:site-specific recombinase XerD
MFRRTFASMLPRGGVDIVTVKELPWHASITSSTRCAHFNDGAKRRAAQRLPARDKAAAIVERKAKVAV